MRDPRDVAASELADARLLDTIVRSDEWARVVFALKLSPREREIIECLLGGTDAEAQIAEHLGMSSHTVHTHIERLYRKLCVTSRSQLLARVFVAYVTYADYGRQ